MRYDDEHLARLVRDAADAWIMPPVRLDQPTWRDRVRPDRSRRGMVDLFRPVSRAIGLAVALLVAVAVLGVALNTRAPQVPFAQPSNLAVSSSSPRVSTTPSLEVSPRPSFAVTGALPSVTRGVVFVEGSGFVIADLADGKLNAPFVAADFGSAVRQADDGTLFCICLDYGEVQNGQPTKVAISFQRFTADGVPIADVPIDTFTGAPDPRDGTGVPEEPSHVIAAVSFGSDPRFAYVGFSARLHPLWKSGLLVIDVGNGDLVKKMDLPSTSDGDASAGQVTDAPRVAGNVGEKLLVGRSFYTWSPRTSRNPGLDLSLETFLVNAHAEDVQPAEIATVDTANDCGTLVEHAGGLVDGGLWFACLNQSNQLVFQRIDPAGLTIDSSVVDTEFGDGGLSVVSPDGRFLYVWNPVEAALTRVDIASNQRTTVRGTHQASSDMLDQFSAWLVPPTRGKILLRSGIVLSADGSHAYAVGVLHPGSLDASGSTGIYDFTLGESMSVMQWQPTSDFVSIALSGEGNWVYAAGMPGVDASGAPTDQQASVTVFDARTGAVARYSDGFGNSFVTFPNPILR